MADALNAIWVGDAWFEALIVARDAVLNKQPTPQPLVLPTTAYFFQNFEQTFHKRAVQVSTILNYTMKSGEPK